MCTNAELPRHAQPGWMSEAPEDQQIRPMVVLHKIDAADAFNISLARGSIEVHDSTFGAPSEMRTSYGDVYLSGQFNASASVSAASR